MQVDFYKMLKILSDPSRIKIIYSLYNKDLYVNDLVGICELSQANVSKHLKSLLCLEIVVNKRESNKILYKLNSEYLKECKIIIPLLEMYEIHEDGQYIKNKIKEYVNE